VLELPYLDEAWEPEAPDENLGQLLMSGYMGRRIRTAVSELPEHYRIVFVLCHFQELKYSEAAEVLEIPIGTVKSPMSAAVRTLSERLMED